MAKIVIDARMINESGIGRYLQNLIKELQVLDKQNEYFILLLRKDFMDSRLRWNDKSNFKKVLADFHWYGFSEQVRLPRILEKINPDLVHFPHFNVPIFYQGKFVVTIHDLIHQHFSFGRATLHNPITHQIKKLGYNQTFRYASAESVKILTPSEFVKNQLIKEWSVPGEKIKVTPEGVDSDITRLINRKSEKNEKVILNKLGVAKPYLFYVGNAHPHKNVESLIKAFIELKKEYPDLLLVFSGADNYFWRGLRKNYKDVEGIVYTGKVSDDQLVALYKWAECFVTASLEEGFGIPILEAMASGTPVVCSNAGSLKEVGGEAAIYFNPQDIGDIVGKVSKVLSDEKLRESLIKKGGQRVKKFSWQKMAEQTLEVYNKSL